MITAAALQHGDTEKLLAYHACEHPLALQVGGSDPLAMARAAVLAEQFQYDEININVGCPSPRVSAGGFGASLMSEPEVVADCVLAMREATSLPVTVKTRIGIDDDEGYEPLQRFVNIVAAAGCGSFAVHARKAWLSGLSTKENREVPPLQYSFVHKLKRDRPDLEIIINGGLNSIEDCEQHLSSVDGVMLGREVYRNPYLLAAVDRNLFNDFTTPPSRNEVLRKYLVYALEQVSQGNTPRAILRHVAGLYSGQRNARIFRQFLSETASRHFSVRQMDEALDIVGGSIAVS